MADMTTHLLSQDGRAREAAEVIAFDSVADRELERG
jgi:hypothetical protein